MADENSLKREYRIDSSDSARPAATLDMEPQHYAQGLKPKPRVIESVEYEVIDGAVSRGKDKPSANLILKTVTYDDGTQIDTTVGEDNELYQQHLKGLTKTSSGARSTRVHTPKRKPEAPKAKAKGKE